MSSDLLGELTSLSVRRLIDAQCDAYERAWVEGRSPRLGDFVAAVSPDARQHALLELVDRGCPPSLAVSINSAIQMDPVT